MIELNGKFNTAKIFTDVVDQSAISQVIELLNQEFVAGSRIRMMPDIHAGAGCTIGTTMTITDKIVPNLVGVDIGCGMETVRVREDHMEMQRLDKVIRELIPAGLMSIAATIAVGFIGGPLAIGGFLLGNIVSGLLIALFMSNSGGLWDNSKKYIESGEEGGKGSEAHKAAVIGDTVGDPFKDTAGPSINTQITVVSLVASLLSTLFVMFSIFH